MGGIVILLSLVILGLVTSAFFWCDHWLPWWYPSETLLRRLPSWIDGSRVCPSCCLSRMLWYLECLLVSLGIIFHGVIISIKLLVWFMSSRKHLVWLVTLPHFFSHIPYYWWSPHMWWICIPFLVPWHIWLAGWIFLVGLCVFPNIPLLSTGILSCR